MGDARGLEVDNEGDENQRCEEIFEQSLVRLADGRYQVALPFNGLSLGESERMAYARFFQNKKLYEEGIREYVENGYIEKISVERAKNYLPHSSVFKMDNLTMKLRIVFDASAKTTNQRSLKDVLMTGPALQADIPVLLMRFREKQFCFLADVQKMFLQIRVDPEQRKFLCLRIRKGRSKSINIQRSSSV